MFNKNMKRKKQEEEGYTQKKISDFYKASNKNCCTCGKKIRALSDTSNVNLGGTTQKRESSDSELEFPLIDSSDEEMDSLGLMSRSNAVEEKSSNKITVLQNVVIRSEEQLRIDTTIDTIVKKAIEFCSRNDNRKKWAEEKEKEDLQKLLKWVDLPKMYLFPRNVSDEASVNLSDDLSDEIDSEVKTASKVAGDEKGVNLSFDYLYIQVMSNTHLKNLFTANEKTVLNNFYKLIPEYKSLCLHLFIRGNMWSNMFSLAKSIICKLKDRKVCELYEKLHADGILLEDLSSKPTVSLLKTLNVRDLDHICKKLNVAIKKTPSSRRKKLMIDALLHKKNIQRFKNSFASGNIRRLDLRRVIYEVVGKVVKLTPEVEMCLIKLHHLYAFVNEELIEPKMLYEFLHKKRKEEVTLMKYRVDNVDFFEIDDFDSYVQAFLWKKEIMTSIGGTKLKNYRSCFEMSEKMYKELEKLLDENLYQISYPKYVMQFSAGTIYANVLTEAASYLAKRYTDSTEKWLLCLLGQNTYSKHKKGLWYDTLATIYFKYLNNMEKAVSVISEAMADESLSEVDRVRLSITGRAMKKGLSCTLQEYRDKIDRCCLPVVCDFEWRDFPCLFKNRAKTKLVNTAIANYKREGFDYNLCLTNFLPTTLCIFLWDVLYNHYVHYAFVSDIQFFPLDLPFNFYETRADKIDDVLSNIGMWPEEEFVSVVKEFWRNHSYKKTLVDTNAFSDVQDLLKVFLNIDRTTLTNIIRRLVINYQQNVAGFSDLFIMNANKECKFIYVVRKGQTCTAEQLLWIRYLQLWELNVEVCFINCEK